MGGSRGDRRCPLEYFLGFLPEYFLGCPPEYFPEYLEPERWVPEPLVDEWGSALADCRRDRRAADTRS